MLYNTRIIRTKVKETCIKCGAEMENIQACHQRCPNCGSELTCSDV